MIPAELYILRHGIAEDEDPAHPSSDHHRRLTPLGVRRSERVAEGMQVLGLNPGALWTSPHVRARQTADAIGRVLEPTGGIRVLDALGFAGSNRAVVEALRDARFDRIMLVGHEPMLGDLVANLVSHGVLRQRFKKAGLAHVGLHTVGDRVVGELHAYLPPRVLRTLARVEDDV